MSQVRKIVDGAGLVQGWYDLVHNRWVPDPELSKKLEEDFVASLEEAPATDADDDGEPELDEDEDEGEEE